MPLVTLWSDVYYEETGQQVNYNSIGSGGGVRAHMDGLLDFAASEAPLSPEQTEAVEPTLTLPFTIGTVAVAYNLEGVNELRLTPDVIAGIYLGEVRHWDHDRIQATNENTTLPDDRITVVHRSDGSGTTYIWTDYLATVSDEWATQVGTGVSVSWPEGIGGNGNEGVAGAVANNPGSIGYIELSYAKSLNATTAHLQNQAGEWIEPSLEASTIAAGNAAGTLPAGHEPWYNVSFVDPPGEGAYPVSSFSYFLTYKDPCEVNDADKERAETIRDWLHWATTEGQAYNTIVDNAPLPDPVREINLESLQSMTCNGEPLDPIQEDTP